MPLQPRDKLGPYEILAPIGAGGMGEVYRARDAKLERDVAIKVLPDSVAQDPERLARFEREAKVLASLNHPNIAHIYGVEERALVMELVEGESPKGPMSFDDAWKIGAQIADALEYAHEKGIVHRDLKPANIKVTPEGVVKLLDFGLAKAFTGPAVQSAAPENSPTLTIGATQVGVILGTAAYMSPEQAKGKAVDQRADIWAFGVVLYELLAGQHLFQGDDVSEILAAVIKEAPDFSPVPRQARPLLERCLEKDPKKRLRHVGDIGLLLAAEAMAVPAQRQFGAVAWIAAGVMTAALAALAFVHFRERPPVQEVTRFQIEPLEKTTLVAAPPIVSPDGRRLAFVATEGGVTRLWVRSLDVLDARPLTGTDGVGGNTFAWSPDSRSIAYFQGSKLRQVDVTGGPPQTVCDSPAGDRGSAWGLGGEIIFGIAAGGLLRVSEAGGAPVPLTQSDAKRGETFHSRPSFLPDGRHFFYIRGGSPEVQGIYLGSLDVSPGQQTTKRLLVADGIAVYTPSADRRAGYVLFLREGALMAQPFDAKRLELAGSAFPIAESVGTNFQNSWFSASTNGVLVYRTGAGTASGGSQLTWFDRSGKSLGAAGEPGAYQEVTLSPDGTRAAATRIDSSNSDIWLHEFARSTTTRLTFDPAPERLAAWSPDGKRLAFTAQRVVADLYQKPADGAGNEEVLFRSKDDKFLSDWSRDGRFLMYMQQGAGGIDLWALPLQGERKPVAYLKSGFGAAEGRFSPDTRFVAFSSIASGNREIYVRTFPDASGGQWMVSRGGGAHPRWRSDGKELFYISAGSQMMSVDVSLTPTFKAGIPKALFPAPILGGPGSTGSTHYDVTADGKRFLINSMNPETNTGGKAPPITVVLNWQAGLKK